MKEDRPRAPSGRLVISGLAALGLLATVGLIALRSVQVPKKNPLPMKVANTAFVRELMDRLEKEPCHRDDALKLAEELNRLQEYRAVVERTEAFVARCGPYSRLLWPQYEALQKLSDNQRAISVATKLIEEDPGNYTFWWWRAFVYERIGELEKAAADYSQSLSVEPGLDGIPINLANVLERLGRPCDAMLPLEQLAMNRPSMQDNGALRNRLDRLRALPGCAALAGQGRAVVQSSGSVFTSPVRINGKRGTFIIDTGASFVTLTQRHADTLGISATGAQVRLRTANGLVDGHLGVAHSVELQNARADRVPVVVVQKMSNLELDGLLGMSFLARFDVQLGKGMLTLSQRLRPGEARPGQTKPTRSNATKRRSPASEEGGKKNEEEPPHTGPVRL